jgi:hypothetical protein
MRLIDTNGVQHALARRIEPVSEYYLAPEIVEELEMWSLFEIGSLRTHYLALEKAPGWDPQAYLRNYKRVLNRTGGRSFYNMTGFGDISILAAVHTLIEVRRRNDQQDLFVADDPLHVYTGDEGLTRRLNAEFGDEAVVVLGLDKID